MLQFVVDLRVLARLFQQVQELRPGKPRVVHLTVYHEGHGAGILEILDELFGQYFPVGVVLDQIGQIDALTQFGVAVDGDDQERSKRQQNEVAEPFVEDYVGQQLPRKALEHTLVVSGSLRDLPFAQQAIAGGPLPRRVRWLDGKAG